MTTFSDEEAAKISFTSQGKVAFNLIGEPRNLDIGEIADDRDARIGAGPRFTKDSGAVVVVREGALVLGVTVEAGKEGTVDRSMVQELAAVITDRAHQVQNGEKATAAVGRH